MKKLDYGSLVAAGIAFVVGSAGGYTINAFERADIHYGALRNQRRLQVTFSA